MGIGDFISQGVGGMLSDVFGSKASGPSSPSPGQQAWYGGSQDASQAAQDYYRQQALAAQGRGGPGIDYGQANADYGMQLGSRGQGQDALSLMQQAAYGNAPSQAAVLEKQGVSDAVRGQLAAAASARGGAYAQSAANQQAAEQAGRIQSQGVANAAALRAQEMAQARQQYYGAVAQQRAQDLQAQGLSAQQAQAQAALEMQQRQLNDQMTMGYQGMGQQVGMGNLGAAQGAQGLQQQTNLANAQMNQQNVMGLMNMMASTAKGMAMGGA